MKEALPKANWNESFQTHILIFQNFLTEKEQSFIRAEIAVYLAGMIARQLDDQYVLSAEKFLIEDLSALKSLIRKHDLFLGQNAPIAISSKITAEFLTLRLALEQSETLQRYQLLSPATFFKIASNYYRKSGKMNLSHIHAFLSQQLVRIIDLLSRYLEELPPELPTEVRSIPESNKAFQSEASEPSAADLGSEMESYVDLGEVLNLFTGRN